MSATVTGKQPSGVVLAQGGRQHGYAVSLEEGRVHFDVRKDTKVTRISSPLQYSGTTTIKATLLPKQMTLQVNGVIVARGESPGLIQVQPQDELSLGEDTQTAAGNYQPPNKFSGKIIASNVKTDKPVD
ncbi:MAG: LamG domain-containing protein [Planctomycetota bacterium]|nr:LamG domain-containing protein [Planctomycetota bacterium]